MTRSDSVAVFFRSLICINDKQRERPILLIMKQIWLGRLGAVVLLLASYAVAPLVHAQSTGVAVGKAAFDARCARCHQVARLQGYMAKRPDDATRGADLDAFLTRHHASDAAERQAIIAWLLTQQAAATP